MHTRRLPRAFSSFRLHPTALSLASVALTSVSLVACTQMPGGLEEPGELGHATPVANPSDSTPAGEVVDGALSGMNILDDVAVLRAGGDAASTVLTVLPTIELASGGALGSDSPQAKEITINAHCGEPSLRQQHRGSRQFQRPRRRRDLQQETNHFRHHDRQRQRPAHQ